MSAGVASARVLVATDNLDDADQIVRHLELEFDQVRASTDPDHAVRDFEEHQPAVLVLAFDRLEKAQQHYLGLYRLGKAMHEHPHRTIILCAADEVRMAADLCRKSNFDEYVMYWPHSSDAPRLATSIWLACQSMAAEEPGGGRQELAAQAAQLASLERSLREQLAEGEVRLGAARQSIHAAGQAIASSVDAFSQGVSRGNYGAPLEGLGKESFAREVEGLKHRQAGQLQRAASDGVAPLGEWAGKLQAELEPALAGQRALVGRLRAGPAQVMVVEDDAFACKLLERILDPKDYEVMFVGDGLAALCRLRRFRPDVILMDVNLPGMDGVTLTQQLKASPALAEIPIIMMTGDARRETLRNSMKVGAAAFVVKPFTRELLTAKLQSVLPRRDA